jgi:electron transfer flavoprotein beta subunit
LSKNEDMSARVIVLASIGRNPVSGRARRAAADASAVALALRIASKEGVEVVHAGDPAAPALRDYLGMGLLRLTVLPVSGNANPGPALLAHLRHRRPALILTGERAEAGEASGFLPYWLAGELAATLLPEVVDLRMEAEGWSAILAAPGGRRRRVCVAGSLVATMGRGAAPPPLAAYGQARRGEIICEQTGSLAPAVESRAIKPARPRPKRLVATVAAQTGRGPQVGIAPEEAARMIADFLAGRGFLV